MSRISDLIAAEVAANEQADELSADAPLPENVKVTRGHDRSKVLQVRLNEDEYRMLVKMADAERLPVSTYVRAFLLQIIGH